MGVLDLKRRIAAKKPLQRKERTPTPVEHVLQEPPLLARPNEVLPSSQLFTPSEEKEEIEKWFLANVLLLPREPFQLSQGVRVVNAEKFYASLTLDVDDPNSPRRRSGALRSELHTLRQLSDLPLHSLVK